MPQWSISLRNTTFGTLSLSKYDECLSLIQSSQDLRVRICEKKRKWRKSTKYESRNYLVMGGKGVPLRTISTRHFISLTSRTHSIDASRSLGTPIRVTYDS